MGVPSTTTMAVQPISNRSGEIDERKVIQIKTQRIADAREFLAELKISIVDRCTSRNYSRSNLGTQPVPHACYRRLRIVPVPLDVLPSDIG